MDWPARLSALPHVRLFTIGGTGTTVGSALAGRHFSRRGIDDDIALQTTAMVLQVVVWLVGIEVVLHILGIRLATLFATTGFLALGAGFGIKGVVENWLAGVILRVGQTVRPGDIVVVQDRWLQVKRTGIAITFRQLDVRLDRPSGGKSE